MTEIISSPSGLVAFTTWLRSLGRDAVTGWRWRQRGWIQPINIAGRLYVSRDAIGEFERRAKSGEFAKPHRVPTPPTQGMEQEAA